MATKTVSTLLNAVWVKKPPEKKQIHVISSDVALINLANKMSKLEEFAFDTETNTLKVYGPNKKFELVGVSICWGEYDNYYIPLGHKRYEDRKRNARLSSFVDIIGPIFEREDIRIIGHNLKFDLHVIARVGVNIRTKDVFCTQVASWLTDENTLNGLKEDSKRIWKASQDHFKDLTDTVPKEIKKEFGYKATSKVPFSLVLINDGAPYALNDSFYTWFDYLYYLDFLDNEDMSKVYFKTFMPFLLTLYRMEERGVDVNTDILDELSVEIHKDLEQLEYDMYEIMGVEFNPSSSQQLQEILYGYRKPDKPNKKTGKVTKAKINENLVALNFGFKPLFFTDSGAPSTDNTSLLQLSRKDFKNNLHKKQGIKLCLLLLKYKKLDKLCSAFIDGMRDKLYDDGKAHPNFKIGGATSGRISCSEPNLQQLPKADENDKYQIRSLFRGSVDSKGVRKKLIAIDFSNLEMRVLAHFSKDKNLLEMFATGTDTHGSTAVNMFGLKCTPAEVKKLHPHLRQAAKIINFLLMYGGSAPTLYESLLYDEYNPIDLGAKEFLDEYHVKKGVDVAQIFIDKYFASYSGVASFIRAQKRYAHEHEFVYTLLSRKRRLPNINSNSYKEKSYCERLSVNGCIQGSAADLTMSAQNRVDKDPWFVEHEALMLLQVHDELVLECPEQYVEECIARLQRYMEHPFGDKVELNLPMKADADFGDTYQEAK